MTAIPEQMKNDTWAFYENARSNDPRVAIPFTRKLVSNLIIEARMLGETHNNDRLDKCLILANEAVRILSNITSTNIEDNEGWGPAMIKVEAAIDIIGDLIYDPLQRYARMQSGAFRYPKTEVKQ